MYVKHKKKTEKKVHMRSAVTSQVFNQIEIMRSPSKLLLLLQREIITLENLE